MSFVGYGVYADGFSTYLPSWRLEGFSLWNGTGIVEFGGIRRYWLLHRWVRLLYLLIWVPLQISAKPTFGLAASTVHLLFKNFRGSSELLPNITNFHNDWICWNYNSISPSFMIAYANSQHICLPFGTFYYFLSIFSNIKANWMIIKPSIKNGQQRKSCWNNQRSSSTIWQCFLPFSISPENIVGYLLTRYYAVQINEYLWYPSYHCPDG